VNLRQALAAARESLTNIDEASLEGEIILRNVLGVSRAHLYSHLEDTLNHVQEKALKQALERRLRGEPSSYITGHHEFYGLDFIINHNVLIPRPETELLVEKIIEAVKKYKINTIADIGTGSGAIAVSLAVNLPGAKVYATDISSKALEVAEQNCKKHNVDDRIVLLHGNLLEPLIKNVDIVTANLPYVRKSDLQAQKELSYEPREALDGGRDGLDVIRNFCKQAGEKRNLFKSLFLEIGMGQSKQVIAVLSEIYPEGSIEVYRDMAGIERIVSLSLTQTRKF